MRLKILNVQDVAETQLCCGCGACAYISPDGIAMVDVLDHGRRPRVNDAGLHDGRDALAVCPGLELKHTFDRNTPGLIQELLPGWGPILEIWEGYAADPEIRFAGSSGGVASALALYAIEHGGMHGVLHTAAREDVPYLNHTVLTRTRQQILVRTGSRYAPASPCDGLQQVEDAPTPCVFVGKPCDVAATAKARAIRPRLDEKLGLTIAVFCAGTPTTRGTLEMLRAMGVTDPSQLLSLRYRGHGWPGKATARFRTPEGEQVRELTYEQSWGEVLTKHVQWRCRLCPDHTGEFADISVGDPWYRPDRGRDPGQSLVLVRTERGRDLLRRAVEVGYLVLKQAEPDTLPASQPNLLRTRGAVWARLWVCRLLGAAVPRYRRIPMFRFWVTRLGIKERLQSIIGTARRIVRKGLRGRAKLQQFEPAGHHCSREHEGAIV